MTLDPDTRVGRDLVTKVALDPDTIAKLDSVAEVTLDSDTRVMLELGSGTPIAPKIVLIIALFLEQFSVLF